MVLAPAETSRPRPTWGLMSNPPGGCGTAAHGINWAAKDSPRDGKKVLETEEEYHSVLGGNPLDGLCQVKGLGPGHQKRLLGDGGIRDHRTACYQEPTSACLQPLL